MRLSDSPSFTLIRVQDAEFWQRLQAGIQQLLEQKPAKYIMQSSKIKYAIMLKIDSSKHGNHPRQWRQKLIVPTGASFDTSGGLFVMKENTELA